MTTTAPTAPPIRMEGNVVTTSSTSSVTVTPEEAASGAAAAALPTLPRVQLGVNTTNSTDQARIIADLDLAHELGFTWVRCSFEMQWGFVEPGRYALEALERYVAGCKERGLRLIQCCQGMPASLARGGQAGHYGPRSTTAADQWGTWFAECCARVQETNGITSCLNEPNGFGWDTTPSARDCAVLHVAAFRARDRLAPEAIVATAELQPDYDPEPLAFLQAILVACGNYDLLDEQKVTVGWHPYTDPRWDADADEVWNTCHKMRLVHNFLASDGHPRMKIVGGEWGCATGPAGNVQALSPQGVADYVRTSYLPAFGQQAADGVRLGPMCWYALRDFRPPSDRRQDSWPNYCGCVTVAGQRKPVAAVLEAYNRGAL